LYLRNLLILGFYPTLTEFFADGFRLSKGMTLKNALAGIWWGGGKGYCYYYNKVSLLEILGPSLYLMIKMQQENFCSGIMGNS
jgi:hypothetical protein